MSEHHAYDHSTPAWGWALIIIAIAMFAGLIAHVVVDHGKGAPVPRTGDATPVVAPSSVPQSASARLLV